MKKNPKTTMRSWGRWRYKNTTLLILSLILLIILVQTPTVDGWIESVGNLGYIGAFLAGIFFVSTFTAAPAGLVLFRLADHLQPIEIALFAGMGAMIGDYIIFRLVRDKVFDELKPILGKIHTPTMRALFKTPYFAWLLPVIGAVIIASPLPDEVGVSMLGISKLKRWQFFTITFLLNACGIFLIVSAAKL